MTDNDESWFDPDIVAMSLGYGEKAGLQIYRNYTRSFEVHAIKKFKADIDGEELDLEELKRLIKLIATEDVRFLPVIVCAFADDILKTVFTAILPPGIPGGRSAIMSGYGPLSDFSKRIQLAYAFKVL